MPDTTYETGYLGSAFSVTIDGVDMGRFSSIEGVGFTVEITPSNETNAEGKLVTHHVPGRVHYGPIQLSRELTDDNALLDWHKTISEEGEPDRKSGEIVFYNRAGSRRGAFAFEGAFIETWSCTDLDARADGTVYESVSMSVDRIYRVDG